MFKISVSSSSTKLSFFKLLKLLAWSSLLVVGLSASNCNSSGGALQNGGLDEANTGCSGDCPNQSLSAEDVDRILRQAVAGANQLGTPAVISITDRVGNVLGVYQMEGALSTTQINSGKGNLNAGLSGMVVDATLAAISKAGTAAYLSSQGAAFSTRTVGQLIQENFNPGEFGTPSGPLFGVQFSQSVCSDVPNLNPDLAAGLNVSGSSLSSGLVGPRPLPLGLSGDIGGIPIYKNGDPVGGIGVELNGNYSVDLDSTDLDDSAEERIAMQGTIGGFETPSERSADRLFVLGKSLRLTDLSYDDLEPLPSSLPELNPNNIISVPLFFGGNIIPGSVFGTPQSGISFSERNSVVIANVVDQNGNNRFPSINGSSQGGLELTAEEVEQILNEAVFTAARARASLRLPTDSNVRSTFAVTDVSGNILGLTQMRDTTIFSIGSAVSKARTAAFFSSPSAASSLSDAGFSGSLEEAKTIGDVFFAGEAAYSTRTLGQLSRPSFPDGEEGTAPGPFSTPSSEWGIFNLGMQSEITSSDFVVSPAGDVPSNCAPAFGNQLVNGVQFVPGGVPLYRNGVVIGGLGISGDGVDQDDLVAFFSSSRFAPGEVSFPGELDSRLVYINCPERPFRGTNDLDVCGTGTSSQIESNELTPIVTESEETPVVTNNEEVIEETVEEVPVEEDQPVEETVPESNLFLSYNCTGPRTLTPVGGSPNTIDVSFNLTAPAIGQPYSGTVFGGFDIAQDGGVSTNPQISFPIDISIDETGNANGTLGGTALSGNVAPDGTLILQGGQSFSFRGDFDQFQTFECTGI